jgi:hypothetical protein
MCKLGLVFLISLLTGNAYAQEYFVLLQSDNQQPFYVRLGGVRNSSSPEGHLILAQLKDSTYTIAIGFPSQPGAEQTYSIGIAQKDQEFLIKDHGEAGWGLFDPRSREWIAVISRSGGREEVRAIGVRRDDAFSRLMAGVVQDTAVLYNDYAGANLAISRSAAPPASTSAPSAHPGTNPINPNATSANPGAKPIDAGATGSNPTTTSALVTDTSLASRPETSKADSPNISVSRASAQPDSQAAAGSVDSSARSIAANPGASRSAVLPPPTGQPVAVTHPDTVTMTPKPLHRPISDNAQHKSAPVVDSSSIGISNPAVPGVVKVSEKRLTRNMRLVYADKGNGTKADTVVVIIPLDTSRAAAAKPRSTSPDSGNLAKARIAAADSARLAKSRTTSSDSARSAKLRPTPDSGNATPGGMRGPNPDSPNQNSTVKVIVPTPANPPADKTRASDTAKKHATKPALPYVNSDCHNFATDYDVDKLRVRMLEATKDEDRVAAALKVFKTKCFSTRQLRALSEVFTADTGKYRFFETAYPFAADEHFPDLVTQLTDPVYINKFKTLTGSH